MPPRWLPRVLTRIRNLAAEGSVRFTYKALRELAELAMGLDEEDGCDMLAELTVDDFAQRLVSARTGEWMYVFKPIVASTQLYVKVVIRANCVVISLHEDEVPDGR